MLRKLFCSFFLYLLFFSFVFADINANLFKEVKSRYGIKAVLFENKNLPVVLISFAFKNSGYIYDEANKSGLSNLVSLILEEGTTSKDKLTFAKELAKMGIQISFNVDQEYFYCNIRALPENIDKAFELFHEVIFSPNLDEQSLKRAKMIQKSLSDRSKDQPRYVAMETFFTKAFSGTPYSNSKYGTEKSLESISISDVHDFIDNTFNRINLSVAVVGNIDCKSLSKLLDNYIIDFPLTIMNVKKIDKKAKLSNKGEQVNVEQNIPQNVIIFVHNGLPIYDKDFYNLVILNYLLGGSGFNSVLMQEIREKKGYTYGISTTLYNSNNLNLLIGYVSTASETVNEVITSLKRTISTFQNSVISEERLESAKRDIINSFTLDLDSSINILNNIVYIQKNDLSIDYMNSYLEGIRKVKVESLNNFIKSFLDSKSLFIVNAGKTKQ